MYVRVRVTPSAKRESLIEADARNFSASVKEPAERNLANTRVRELLAERFGIPAGRVRLISGHRSPQKVFAVGDD